MTSHRRPNIISSLRLLIYSFNSAAGASALLAAQQSVHPHPLKLLTSPANLPSTSTPLARGIPQLSRDISLPNRLSSASTRLRSSFRCQYHRRPRYHNTPPPVFHNRILACSCQLTPARSGRAPLNSDGQISSCRWLLLLLPAMLLQRASACRQGLRAAWHCPMPSRCDSFQLLSTPLRISIIISVLHQRFIVHVQTLRSAGCSPAALEFSLWLRYYPRLPKQLQLLDCTNDSPNALSSSACATCGDCSSAQRIISEMQARKHSQSSSALALFLFILFAPISRPRRH